MLRRLMNESVSQAKVAWLILIPIIPALVLSKDNANL